MNKTDKIHDAEVQLGNREHYQQLEAPMVKTPGGALGYFLGGYVPPGTPNWHPVLKKISPKIDTPF